jgi:hypothetical protein
LNFLKANRFFFDFLINEFFLTMCNGSEIFESASHRMQQTLVYGIYVNLLEALKMDPALKLIRSGNHLLQCYLLSNSNNLRLWTFCQVPLLSPQSQQTPPPKKKAHFLATTKIDNAQFVTLL